MVSFLLYLNHTFGADAHATKVLIAKIRVHHENRRCRDDGMGWTLVEAGTTASAAIEDDCRHAKIVACRSLFGQRHSLTSFERTGESIGMRLIQAPRELLLASASLFALVPLSVVTAGVFSTHVWWDLPVGELRWVGWIILILIAPLSWRLMMGRRGAFESLVVVIGLLCLFLGVRALAMRGTLQGVWTLTLTGLCVSLLAWIRRELAAPYFDPRMGWFAGLPPAMVPVEARWLDLDSTLSVARLGPTGVFVFSSHGAPPSGQVGELELSFRERKVRLTGSVVRQFSHPGAGWGAGVRFGPLAPDAKKDFGDFLNAIRAEGHIS